MDLDSGHWRNLTIVMQENIHATGTDSILLSLMVVQALQVVCCFPFLHVTRILYGYFFGWFAGGMICSVYEAGLVVVFVITWVHKNGTKPAPKPLITYTDKLRADNQMCLFLFVLQMASVPLVTGTSLVVFEVVTQTEFLLSHITVTILMSFKDTLLGGYVAEANGQTHNMVATAVLFLASTLMPAVLSVVLLGMVSRHALKAMQSDDSTEEDGFTDCLIAEDTADCPDCLIAEDNADASADYANQCVVDEHCPAK